MTGPESLEGIPFLSNLTDDERAQVAALATRKQVPAGTTLLTEGEADDALHVLVKGLVSFRILQEGGGEDSCMGTTNEPGYLFGMSAVLGDEHKSPYGAVCLEDCELLEFDGAQFRQLCEDECRVGAHVLRQLIVTIAQRLHAARAQIRSRVRPGLISHG